jgi:histidinol dehydrogenase
MSAVRRVRLRAGGAPVLARTLRPPVDERDVAQTVASIIADVRARGDEALVEDARRFGTPGFVHDHLRVPRVDVETAADRLDPALRAAIVAAAAQVRTLAEAVAPTDQRVTLPYGQTVTVRAVPVDAAGCYVPGGRAAYTERQPRSCSRIEVQMSSEWVSS